ncbi:MAG: XRE family transcriptional regulator [Nostoc sp. DedQUE04]|uniref:XRE family transcriptional regulator n=1 Tax=Nostoc sp. DedQUE04 TaxID=3075390 RepID=UPI002AD1F19C|nr:XRE family transcriptional regulator [Nostoc sp. DedQUE04]MDZ8139018.1 XRE family transcriptional regulator [Nostoc sp. DedQUE04]
MSTEKPIAKMREKMGLTQAELSLLVGVSENTIANWEKGSASKWIRHLSRLCKILNCSLEDLEPEKQLQEHYRFDLTPNTLNAVKSYCLALFNNDKKAVTKISSFATLYDNQLRYWLDQADRIINQPQCDAREQVKEVDCEKIINALILYNLIIQLSYVLPNQITLEKFCEISKKVRLSHEFLSKDICFNEQHFSRKLILQTRYLSVYVIGWEPSQESPMHHHGNSLDAILILEGEMTHWLLPPEECKSENVPSENVPFEAYPSGQKFSGKAEKFTVGDWVFIDRHYAHQIANSSAKRLATLHVRFGAPPDDDKWEPSEDQPVSILQQTKQYQVMPCLEPLFLKLL